MASFTPSPPPPHAHTLLTPRPRPRRARAGPPERRAARLARLLAALNAGLLLAALLLAGTFAWLVDVRLMAQAAGGAQPWWPGAPPAAAPPAPAPAPAALLRGAPWPALGGGAAAPWAAPTGGAGGVGGAAAAAAPQPPKPACPRSCIDLGALSAALGLPTRCVCLPPFLVAQLASALGRVLWQLAGALVGALLVLGGVAALAQATAGALALAGGGALLGLAPAGGGGGGVRAPLLLPGGGAGGAAEPAA
jgi:hypothetical protein